MNTSVLEHFWTTLILSEPQWGTLMHRRWSSVPLHFEYFEWGQNPFKPPFASMLVGFVICQVLKHFKSHLSPDLECLVTKSVRAMVAPGLITEFRYSLYDSRYSGDDFQWIWMNFSFGNWSRQWQRVLRGNVLRRTNKSQMNWQICQIAVENKPAGADMEISLLL